MKLLTADEYARLTPKQQGYATYMQAEIKGSRIPKKCPYEKGSRNADQFGEGQFIGVLEAQEGEE